MSIFCMEITLIKMAVALYPEVCHIQFSSNFFIQADTRLKLTQNYIPIPNEPLRVRMRCARLCENYSISFMVRCLLHSVWGGGKHFNSLL